jgi:hypothetical protein
VCNNAEATWYKEIRHALRCTQRQHTALCKHRGYCWSCILQFGLCREAELMLCTKDKLDSQSWHTEMYEQSAMAHGDVWTEMYGTRRCMDNGDFAPASGHACLRRRVLWLTVTCQQANTHLLGLVTRNNVTCSPVAYRGLCLLFWRSL